MQQEFTTQPLSKPAFNDLPPPYEESETSQLKGQTANLPCTVQVPASPKITPRGTDGYYQYDLVRGTTLKEHKIDNAALAWLISGVVLFAALFFTTLFLPIAIPIIPALIILAVPVCMGIYAIAATVFFSNICSNSSHKHAQQALGPTTQDKADDLQRQAMEFCNKKQQEINILKLQNKHYKEQQEGLKMDAKREFQLFNEFVINQRHATTHLEHVSKAYFANLAMIDRKQKEINRMSQIYCLNVDNDEHGFPDTHPVKHTNPQDLPK